MFTSRPDLDATVDPDRAKEVYQKVYDWFVANGRGLRRQRRRAAAGQHRDHRPVRRRRSGRRRRSVQRGQGGHRRLQRHRRAPTWTPPSRSRRPGPTWSCPESPWRSGRWSRTTASSSDRRIDQATLLARTLREESGRLVARLARQFHDFDLAEEAVQARGDRGARGLAARRYAGPAGGLAADRRPPQRARPGPAPGPSGRARRSDWPSRRPSPPSYDARHRRPARPALRVLPPGTRSRGPARAHAARRHRHDDAADRTRVPGQRADAGPAHRPGQAQDRHRRHRAHGAGRRRARPSGSPTSSRWWR